MNKISETKFTIWDLGNVIVDVDAKFPFSYYTDDHSFIDFEIGKITSEQFFKQHPKLKKSFNNYLSINNEMVDLVKKTPNSYFLSNTNEYHYNYLTLKTDILERQRCFLSFEIGLRKPDHHIYEFVQNTLYTLPSHIYFVDDQLRNIEMAQKLGWNCFHYQNNIGQLRDWLNNR